MKNSKFIFNGHNNILFCEEGVNLNNSKITFNGNNSLIYLRQGTFRINATIHTNSVLYIGTNNYFNQEGQCTIICSEEKNIFIGNNNLFSFGIYIRNADPHLIYDNLTQKRINHSRSVYIGDHVWIGQNTILLKGSQVHSGSIIGASSLVAGKSINSNTAWGGNPIKQIKDNCFWIEDSVHNWTKEDTLNNMYADTNSYIFSYSQDETISFDYIEEALNNSNTSMEKLEFLSNLPVYKNRFSL